MGLHQTSDDTLLDYAQQHIDGMRRDSLTIGNLYSLSAMFPEADRLMLANMTTDSSTTDTSTFIEAYMILKLADFGVDRPDLLGLHSTACEVCPYHRTLQCSEIAESKVKAILADLDLIDTLKNLHISKHTLLRTFVYITDTLFSDDVVSWWKIVTLVDCSAQMAVMCVDRELPNMVENLFSWTSMFMEKENVKAWIEENGGWEFLTNRMEKYLERQGDESDEWSSEGSDVE